MKNRKPVQPITIVFLLFIVILLISCTVQENADSIANAPEQDEQPITSEVLEPSATHTLMPTATSTEPPMIKPTNTATFTPTEIPTEASETEEPSPTPEATPFILPDGWLGPQNFDTNTNPLTGETVEDPAVLQRRPIAIKVSNYPPLVRPQAGLNNADLVFEHYAEGGSTRFTAVFYSRDAHTVGSVRSARIIDFEIPIMYDAAFGFSGAAGPNEERFSKVEWFDQIISPAFGHSGFYRAQPDDPDTDFWHTMFTDTYRLRDILIERGIDRAPELQNGMIFSPEPPGGGTDAKQVEIGYRGSYVTWWYDSSLERYFRWNDGEKHIDANREEQINFKNIVVVSAEHVDTWIPETEVGQGAPSIEIQVWGEGPATIFRDGQRFDGRWQRHDPHDMLTFTDTEGNPLPLAPGNTWIELVPLGFDKLYVTS